MHAKALDHPLIDRDRLCRALSQEHERSQLWSAVFDHSAEGIMICDPQRRILTVNAAFETVTGFSEQEAVGKTPSMLHSGRQDAAFYAQMWRKIETTGYWSGEICNRRKNGEFYSEWLTIKTVYDRHGNAAHYVGIFCDLADRRSTDARVRHINDYDPLTDLPNRNLLLHRLLQLLETARQSHQHVAMLFVDLDRFNDVNDSLGHEAGDELLRIVAQRICDAVRHSDVVARIAADEFAVVLPALLDSGDAAEAAQKILTRLHEPILLQGQELVVTGSIGIAVFPGDGTDPEELVRNAAAAMARIKRERRNDYCFYTRALNQRSLERLRTENALRRALDQNELVLHYQPQIDLRSGAIIGTEALVRWNRPGAGLLMPGKFVPLAEDCGLIVPIGQWVMGEAVRQLAAWNSAGRPNMTVAVNISPSEFRQRDFADRVARILGQSSIHPGQLELELTESIAVRDIELTTATLKQLRSLGVRLSLDDFGTGYSSLNYLRHFPIDRIKIDQSFIGELSAAQASVRIVRAIIALARSFGLRVLAEGVELPQQLACLRAEGCDEIQGYLVSRPLQVDQFERFVSGWRPGALQPNAG